MSESTGWVCYDRVVPAEYTEEARNAAYAENPANASPFEAAAVRSKLWKPGRTLRVTFLDGDAEVQQKVEQYAREWTRHANIQLDFVSDPAAEIRISFRQKGSWSALGTDALVRKFFPLEEPTMNYGWLRPGLNEEEYAQVVLHEFGHALGLIHEHQNPEGGIRWDRAAVVRDLSGSPNFWDEATIEFNMFQRYDRTQTQFTKFDPQSIMLYSFPPHWTLDRSGTRQNARLSTTDIDFIKERYPR